MENSKSNKDEDLEKICIAFGVSKAELKFRLEQLEEYTSSRNSPERIVSKICLALGVEPTKDRVEPKV